MLERLEKTFKKQKKKKAPPPLGGEACLIMRNDEAKWPHLTHGFRAVSR